MALIDNLSFWISLLPELERLFTCQSDHCAVIKADLDSLEALLYGLSQDEVFLLPWHLIMSGLVGEQLDSGLL